MQKFPSIESFAHAYRDAANGLTVRPKIKLHGTNGGIRIDGSQVVAQSRNNVLVGTDNAGFAAWVRETEDFWANSSDKEVIFFGEWAGQGIQGRDAITMLDKKAFFIFALYNVTDNLMVTEPDEIDAALPYGVPGVFVLPWAAEATHVDYTNAGNFSDETSAWVEKIGERDPYVAETFGIEGPGEGLVFMPPTTVPLQDFCRVTFKVKAEAHRVKQTKKAMSPKIDVPKDAVDFVLTFVTEARLQQALTEACGGDRSPQMTGAFIKWMCSDIHKESKVELEEMGYEWGALAKFVATASRVWFQKPDLALAA